MDPVVSMTKQGVRNLNNLGPKKPKAIASDVEKAKGGDAPEQSAEQPHSEAPVPASTKE